MCQMRTQFKTVEYSLEFNAHRDYNLFVRYLWVSCVHLPHSIALIGSIMSISKYFTLVDCLCHCMRLTLQASLNLAHSLINVIYFFCSCIYWLNKAGYKIKTGNTSKKKKNCGDILFIWKKYEAHHSATTKPSEYRLVVLSNAIIAYYDHM